MDNSIKTVEKIEYIYLNNQFVTSENAFVSVRDRGFLFGDGVFETIAVHNSVPFAWEQHLLRLELALKYTKISANIDNLQAMCKKLLHKNNIENGMLRIAVSRGVGSQGFLPMGAEATIVIETKEQGNFPENATLYKSSYRKISSDMIPVEVKTAQGLNSTLARIEAKENNCFEALLLNINNEIAECSSSNIFWVKDDIIYTPSIKCGVLRGVIRETLLDISPYKIKQSNYKIEHIIQADEVFITNSSWKILNTVKLEPDIATWQQDKYSKKLSQLLEEYIYKYTQHNLGIWT
jgi:branched-chain amino acid aminotransferase